MKIIKLNEDYDVRKNNLLRVEVSYDGYKIYYNMEMMSIQYALNKICDSLFDPEVWIQETEKINITKFYASIDLVSKLSGEYMDSILECKYNGRKYESTGSSEFAINFANKIFNSLPEWVKFIETKRSARAVHAKCYRYVSDYLLGIENSETKEFDAVLRKYNMTVLPGYVKYDVKGDYDSKYYDSAVVVGNPENVNDFHEFFKYVDCCTCQYKSGGLKITTIRNLRDWFGLNDHDNDFAKPNANIFFDTDKATAKASISPRDGKIFRKLILTNDD